MDQYKVLFDLDILVWMRFNLFGFSAPPFVRHIQVTSFSEVCDMRYRHQVPQAERTQSIWTMPDYLNPQRGVMLVGWTNSNLINVLPRNQSIWVVFLVVLN